MLMKQMSLFISQKLGPCNFWGITSSVFNEGTTDIPSQFNVHEVLFLILVKKTFLLKPFLKT